MLSDLYKFDIQLSQHRILFFTVFMLLVISISITGLNGSLQDRDEAKYANVSRETFEQKSLIPVRNNQYYLHKSPVVYWTAMLSFKIFGVNDFAVKLPSALVNIVSALLILLLVHMLFHSYSAGLIAVFIYLTSFEAYLAAHMILADSTMVMSILGSLYFSLKGIHENRGWIFLAALFNALTILTKSVVGLAVPAALFIYIIIDKRWSFLKFFAVFLVLSLGISVPYFVYVYYKAPEIFVESFLKSNLVQRVHFTNGFFLGRALEVAKHAITYLFFLLALVFPFTPGIFFLFRIKYIDKPLKEIIWGPRTKLLSIFAILVWGVFSTVNPLYPHYTLSVTPILAIYLGTTYREVKDRNIFLYLAGFTLIVLSIFTVFISKNIHRYPIYQDLIVGLFAIYIVFIGLNIALYFMRGNNNVKLLYLTAAYFALFTMNTVITVPADFNADIKSFREIIYDEPETLVVINTYEVSIGYRKTRTTKWYLRMVPEEYRTMELFMSAADQYSDETYFIYYYKYTEQLENIYDTFKVLKAGKVWNLGVTQ